METSQDVKIWYLNDSYNTIISSNSGEKLSDNFRFGCTISENIINLLLSKQSKQQKYLGSNLSVNQNDEIKYELFFYTYYYDNDSKNYLVGRAIYEIVNYSIDYKSYLNSKNYIPLEISIDNLILNKSIIVQAYKQGNDIGSIRLDINTEIPIYFSLLDIYTNKTRKRYGISNSKDINFYYTTPVYIYNYLSRTPSTCVFACNLLKQLKPVVLEKKIITSQCNNIPFN